MDNVILINYYYIYRFNDIIIIILRFYVWFSRMVSLLPHNRVN